MDQPDGRSHEEQGECEQAATLDPLTTENVGYKRRSPRQSDGTRADKQLQGATRRRQIVCPIAGPAGTWRLESSGAGHGGRVWWRTPFALTLGGADRQN